MPPLFAKSAKRARRHHWSYESNHDDEHRPLLARWLIRLTLHFNWHRSSRPGRISELLLDEDFIELTGFELPQREDEDDDEAIELEHSARWNAQTLSRRLRARLKELEAMPLPEDLPLIRNVALLGRRLGLNDAEQAVLRFALALKSFAQFSCLIGQRNQIVNQRQLAGAIAVLADLPSSEVFEALQAEGTLRASGILQVETAPVDLERKLEVIDRLAQVLIEPQTDEAAIVHAFLAPAGPGSLTLQDFPHLEREIELLRDFLRAALERGLTGVNLLFYGPPGTGKTELSKALAQALGVTLYEVSYSNEDGDPIRGAQRLAAYNFCQRMMAHMPKALLLFDEIEDVFASADDDFFGLLSGSRRGPASLGKAWINRTLERNPVPAIWLANRADFDPAYLRRFSDSLYFPIPPQSVRAQIARRHFEDFAPDEAWLARIAACETFVPAQLERAAHLARIVSPQDGQRAQAIVEQALARSARLLGQPQRLALASPTAFDPRFLNIDLDPDKLLAALRRKPYGTFCFYGLPGTGKSEFGRYLARQLDKPVLVRRASDLLSKWVGENEQNIAALFEEATAQQAVLILDEADSFLADRRTAQASWEVSLVNEFLTQMESFAGLFICTTNLMDKLDPATLRRFAFKLKFDALRPEQRQAMFLAELQRLGGDLREAERWALQARELAPLTPGDFAVAARQIGLWDEAPTPQRLYELLRGEVAAKGGAMRSIGFTA